MHHPPFPYPFRTFPAHPMHAPGRPPMPPPGPPLPPSGVVPPALHMPANIPPMGASDTHHLQRQQSEIEDMDMDAGQVCDNSTRRSRSFPPRLDKMFEREREREREKAIVVVVVVAVRRLLWRLHPPTLYLHLRTRGHLLLRLPQQKPYHPRLPTGHRPRVLRRHQMPLHHLRTRRLLLSLWLVMLRRSLRNRAD